MHSEKDHEETGVRADGTGPGHHGGGANVERKQRSAEAHHAETPHDEKTGYDPREHAPPEEETDEPEEEASSDG